MPATVPAFVFDAVSKAASREFALSYLFGAEVGMRVLTPRTTVAYQRFLESPDAMGALDKLEMQLCRPEPWGSPRGSTVQLNPKDGSLMGESASVRQSGTRRNAA